MYTRISILVIFSALAVNCYEDTIKIVPELPELLILEGDSLELNCVHEYNSDTNTEMAVFIFKGQVITLDNTNGYVITTKTTVEDPAQNLKRTTKTLKKNITTSQSDHGSFSCAVGSSLSTAIEVRIITLDYESANLTANMQEVELRCTLSGIGPATVFEFEWKGPDGKLLEGDRFKNFHGNGTLVINKPTRADMGEYHCTVVFNPKNEKEKHSITPKPVFLYAGPAIVSNDNNKNMVEGDKLELKCEVTGYPTPTIGWYKGDQVLNTTITIQFDKYKGIDNGKLVIFELGYDDAGKYKCEAMNDHEPFTVEAVMEVRVKDKLAALWPFLGIVAEVVILCVIILVYEKRRSKKLAEEDETDGPTENTVDHKDVRHRRT